MLASRDSHETGALRLAIIVPTLNEEDTVRRHLPAALAVADEVIVSDGGSADGTVAAASSAGAPRRPPRT